MKNVVILSCGPGLPEIVKKYGHSSDWIPNIVKNDKVNFLIKKVYNNDFEIDVKPDAFIVTGSKYSVYDNSPWIKKLKSYIKQLIDNNNYILGICFGHQILAHCLGGEVKKNTLGWELGSYKIHLSKKGLKNKLFYGFNSEEVVYESHQDVVSSLPLEAVELAYTNKGNQSFCVDGFLYGVQFHPEFSYDVIRKLMDLRIKRGVEIDDEDLIASKNGKNILNNFIDIVQRRMK